jgi:hypothetical protein
MLLLVLTQYIPLKSMEHWLNITNIFCRPFRYIKNIMFPFFQSFQCLWCCVVSYWHCCIIVRFDPMLYNLCYDSSPPNCIFEMDNFESCFSSCNLAYFCIFLLHNLWVVHISGSSIANLYWKSFL